MKKPDLKIKPTKRNRGNGAKANGQAHRGSRPLSDTARLKEFDKLGPFEIKDFRPKSGIEIGAGIFPVVPERRSWQPKLGRH